MEEKKRRRWLAGFLAVIMTITGVGIPLPFPSEASDEWPQKSTAPYYCLDGGKGWKKVDRYDMYKFDTMPSPLTETQAKRLFWAYPDNWSALKDAAKKFDPGLYAEIASTTSSANIVKYVKDDAGTKFAWVADNPEIEDRAIAVMEQASSVGLAAGKEAPDAIRGATSEDTAVPFQVLPFSDGPGALDTEFVLGKEFIRDIAKIEPQSVWDNGSTGGNVGWLDASQDKNIAKSVMGQNLYEVTWSGDAIRIHNNGSVTANENAVGSNMTDEEKNLCREAIAAYKEIRPVVQFGELYRLVSPYDGQGVASLLYASEDKSKAVFYWWKLEQFVNQQLPRVRMAGLDAGKQYRIRELNRIDNVPLSFEGKVLSGSFLMSHGLEIPGEHRVDADKMSDYASRILYLEEVNH